MTLGESGDKFLLNIYGFWRIREVTTICRRPLLDRPSKLLSGNSALVTGATRSNGIGFAIAEKFALEGVSPIIIIGTERSRGIAPFIQSRLIRYGTEVETFVGDITSKASCMEMMERAYERCRGNVNILVNNAGTNKDQPIGELTEENWDYIMRPKTLGGPLMTNEWFRIRNKNGIRGGRVIYIGSVIGRAGNFGQDIYAMANAALVGLTKSQSYELGRYGITVNLVEPGFVEGTDMTAGMSSDQMDVVKTVSALNSLVRPDDVANAVVFLASAYGSKITGETLEVACGVGTNFTAPPKLYQSGHRRVPRQILSQVREWPADLIEVFRGHGGGI